MDERKEAFHKEDKDGAQNEHAYEHDKAKASVTKRVKNVVDCDSSCQASKEDEGFGEAGVSHVEGEDPGVADGVADAFDEVFESFHEAIHEAEEYHSAEEHDDGGEDEEEQHFNHRPGHEVDAVVEDHVGEAPEEK